MRRRRQQLLVLVTPLLLAATFLRPASAQTRGDQGQRTDLLDFVLVLDESGSMRYNDPDRARVEAAQLFLDLPLAGDRVAVVGFGEGAETIVPLQEIEGRREQILAQLSEVESSGKFTMLREALEEARSVLENRTEQRRSAVVVLTDGELQADDIPPDAELSTYLADAYGIAGELAGDRSMVVSLAFTERANVRVLRRLAEQGGGFTEVVDSPRQTARAFYRILSQLVPSGDTTIPEDVTQQEFRVPENARKVSLIAFKNEGIDSEISIEVEGPDGDPVPGTTRNSRFYTILNIDDPDPGRYVARVPPENRLDVQILVINQVRLDVLRPEAGNRLLPAGDRMTVEVRARGGPADSVVGEIVAPTGEASPLVFDRVGSRSNRWRAEYRAATRGTYRVTAAATDSTGAVRLSTTRFEFSALQAKPVRLSVQEASALTGEPLVFRATVPDTSQLRDLMTTVTRPTSDVDSVPLEPEEGTGRGVRYSANYSSTEEPGVYRARIRARFQVGEETMSQTAQRTVPKVLRVESSPAASLDSGASSSASLRLANRGTASARVVLAPCSAQGVEVRPERDTVEVQGGQTASASITIAAESPVADSVIVRCRGRLHLQDADAPFDYAAIVRPDRLTVGEILTWAVPGLLLMALAAFLYCRTRPSFAADLELIDESTGNSHRLRSYQGRCGGSVLVNGDLYLSEGLGERCLELAPTEGGGVELTVLDETVGVELPSGESLAAGETRRIYPGDEIHFAGRTIRLAGSEF